MSDLHIVPEPSTDPVRSRALALADEISEFMFGGLNAYGQPATANQLLLDAVVMLREIAGA